MLSPAVVSRSSQDFRSFLFQFWKGSHFNLVHLITFTLDDQRSTIDDRQQKRRKNNIMTNDPSTEANNRPTASKKLLACRVFRWRRCNGSTSAPTHSPAGTVKQPLSGLNDNTMHKDNNKTMDKNHSNKATSPRKSRPWFVVWGRTGVTGLRNKRKQSHQNAKNMRQKVAATRSPPARLHPSPQTTRTTQPEDTREKLPTPPSTIYLDPSSDSFDDETVTMASLANLNEVSRQGLHSTHEMYSSTLLPSLAPTPTPAPTPVAHQSAPPQRMDDRQKSFVYAQIEI